jgi:hypothetical protein
LTPHRRDTVSVLNDRQRAVCERGIAAANEILPRVEYLQKVAALIPELQPRADQLRVKRDYLLHVSQTLLDVDRMMSNQG